MDIEFIKMQVAGRDAILVDASRNPRVDADLLCGIRQGALDRRTGIGGDAMVFLAAGEDHELSVRSFTARGGEEEPSLNEILCAARYAVDSGLAEGTTARVRSSGHAVALDALDSRSLMADVGPPLGDGGAELVERPEVAYTRTVRIEGRDFTYTPVRVGAFQAVTFVPSFALDIRRTSRGFGDSLPADPALPAPRVPDPAQLTYARVSSRRRLLARTWRYGRGEVRSEGYAAAAAAVAAALHGFTDRDTIVAARGGDLYVLWSESDNHLYVTGTPEYVFTGTYSVVTRTGSERRNGGQAV
jgi:diaminopimelate epimerase